jgi:hypothetical protein
MKEPRIYGSKWDKARLGFLQLQDKLSHYIQISPVSPLPADPSYVIVQSSE